MKKPRLLVNLNNLIGEGPCYDEKRRMLYWIDLLGNKIFSFSFWDSCVLKMELDQNVGCVAVREKGGLVAALQHGYYFVDMICEKTDKIGDPEHNKPKNRFNDGKCDCMGRFWAGTMSKDLDTGYGEYKPEGSLYCLYPDLNIEKKLDNVILSNGIGWSPDNSTMYFIDTPTSEITAFDYNRATGTIANKRTAVKIPAVMGMPDGMCVDSEGKLWVALWGGSAVTRWDPDTGILIETIQIPALNVSSCAFGGANMDELFITTASIGTNLSKYPGAGGLFTLKPGVTGIASAMFKG